MKINPAILTLLFFGCIVFTSCTKNDPDDPNDPCENSTLEVELTVHGTSATEFYITASSNGTGNGPIVPTWSTGYIGFTLEDVTEGSTYSVEFEDTYDGCTATASVTVEPTPTISDIDGNQYDLVTIGSQTWLAQNVNTSRFRNGDPIPEGISSSNTNPGRSVQSVSGVLLSSTVHGTHYNWYAISDSRGVCPEGYHVASEEEWDVLVNGLGGYPTSGNKMKRMDSDLISWGAAVIGNPPVGNNASGFSAVPSGLLNSVGNFVATGETASFWCSNENNVVEAGLRQITKWDGEVLTDQRDKKTGHSCRCVKD